jgi:hypothetical protein
MAVSPGTVLLCVAAAMLARYDCASWTRSVSSPDKATSTTLRLTAQRNDTGIWTTEFGDHEVGSTPTACARGIIIIIIILLFYYNYYFILLLHYYYFIIISFLYYHFIIITSY